MPSRGEGGGFLRILDRARDFFYPAPVLSTPRLTLRFPAMRDVRSVYAYAADERVSRYVLWNAPRTPDDTRRFLRGILYQNRAGEGLSFVVVENALNRVIGTSGFVRLDEDNALGEVGYSFARDVWGRGYAAEALAAVMAYGFDALGLHRVEGVCDVRNGASARVMEKCGMTREGMLRGRVMNKGEFADVWMYAAVARDND